jgi:MFS family permease
VGPLLIGGVVGGVVADRLDRRKTLLTMLGAIIPGAVILSALAATDLLVAWMIFAFLVLVGIGWVGDMTSRRTMVFDIVGQRHLDNAMALEGMSLAGGMTIRT